jgi:hypothetical protein
MYVTFLQNKARFSFHYSKTLSVGSAQDWKITFWIIWFPIIQLLAMHTYLLCCWLKSWCYVACYIFSTFLLFIFLVFTLKCLLHNLIIFISKGKIANNNSYLSNFDLSAQPCNTAVSILTTWQQASDQPQMFNQVTPLFTAYDKAHNIWHAKMLNTCICIEHTMGSSVCRKVRSWCQL